MNRGRINLKYFTIDQKYRKHLKQSFHTLLFVACDIFPLGHLFIANICLIFTHEFI